MLRHTRPGAVLIALTILGGCSLFKDFDDIRPGSDDATGPGIDAMVDVDATAVDASLGDAPPRVAGRFSNCALPASMDFDFNTAGAWLLDTTSDVTMFDFTGGIGATVGARGSECNGAFVLHVGSFRVRAGATVRVVGTRPLLIVADTSIVISGVLDVSSQPTSAGAGAGSNTACTAVNGTANAQGGGGGAGGSLGGRGGNGGPNAIGTPSAAADPLGLPNVLSAGCAGGTGGSGTGQSAVGGRPGGAVHLEAAVAVFVDGAINAGGGRGAGGTIAFGGAGGGGSGGFVGFEAPTVTFETGAIIVANGGSAGGGGDLDEPGNPGQNADVGLPRKSGGSGPSGGVGGSSSGTPGGTPVDGGSGQTASAGTTGAGGGGGSAGTIGVFADVLVDDGPAIQVFPPVARP